MSQDLKREVGLRREVLQAINFLALSGPFNEPTIREYLNNLLSLKPEEVAAYREIIAKGWGDICLIPVPGEQAGTCKLLRLHEIEEKYSRVIETWQLPQDFQPFLTFDNLPEYLPIIQAEQQRLAKQELGSGATKHNPPELCDILFKFQFNSSGTFALSNPIKDASTRHKNLQAIANPYLVHRQATDPVAVAGRAYTPSKTAAAVLFIGMMALMSVVNIALFGVANTAILAAGLTISLALSAVITLAALVAHSAKATRRAQDSKGLSKLLGFISNILPQHNGFRLLLGISLIAATAVVVGVGLGLGVTNAGLLSALPLTTSSGTIVAIGVAAALAVSLTLGLLYRLFDVAKYKPDRIIATETEVLKEASEGSEVDLDELSPKSVLNTAFEEEAQQAPAKELQFTHHKIARRR